MCPQDGGGGTHVVEISTCAGRPSKRYAKSSSALLATTERVSVARRAMQTSLVAHRVGHLGKRAIARDLRERGIAADDAKAALSPLADRDEIADATALWQRRFGQPPADERERARQVRFLVSRGFSAAIAFRVLRAAGARTDDLQD